MTPERSEGRLPETGQRVLYVQYTNPAAYPPLQHSAQLLARAGFEVLLIGTDVLAQDLEFARHPRIRVVLYPSHGPGLAQKWHYGRVLAGALTRAVSWRPDWIYASDPLAAPMALALRAVTGAELIYHEHDSPTPGRPASRFMRSVLAARRRLARRAALCILPNQERARAFSDETGRPDVRTVWNCPMREDLTEGPGEPAGSNFRLLYQGSIVPARLPETLIDALAELPPRVSLTIAGYETAGHPGYVAQLLARADRLGLTGRVRHVGIVGTREALLRLCAACDVGIALLPTHPTDLNEAAMLGASNKVFDYMAAAQAVLVGGRPEWQDPFVSGGYGLGCDPGSAASIAAAVRTWLDRPDLRAAMGQRGRAKIATDWNYETTFAPILARLGPGWAPSPVGSQPAAVMKG
jgi:glycosyltransferase involved in cell wall biosynthesis